MSWQHVAHGWAFFLGALALFLSVFAMAWRFHGDPRWGRADRLVLGLGIVAIAIIVGIFFFADKEAGGNYGLVQRLALTASIVWVLGLALALLDLYGGRRFLGSNVREATSQVGEGTPKPGVA